VAKTFYFITKTYFGKNISVVVGMISEKSCDTENWSNDTENFKIQYIQIEVIK